MSVLIITNNRGTNMENVKCKRSFGKTQITISQEGEICICDDWHTNWGFIYGFQVKSFKEGVINPCTGLHIQVIGMDTSVSKTHSKYIYGRINAGLFDHLI